MAAKGAYAMIAGKLDFLLKLTDTSNSALGRALGFDASYISRIRSGKRGLPRDRFFLEPAAAYFAERLQANPLRKNAAAEAICPGRSWPETAAGAEKLLLGWLSQNERQDMERVERLLNGLAAARLLWPEAGLIPPGEAPSSAAFYYGTEGKREAVLRLLSDYCAAEAPAELLIYSDEKVDWMAGDAAYTRRWSEAVLRLIERGARIRIVHTLSRNLGVMLDGLRKWAPLYLTGAVETRYYPKPRDGVFRRTLIIARDFGAVTATVVGEGDGLNLLLTEPAAVAALTGEFEDYYALCRPLIQIYGNDKREEVWEMLHAFEEAPHPRIVAQRLPLGSSLPEEVIASFGRQSSRRTEDFLRFASETMYAHLNAGLRITELLSLPPAEDVYAGRVSTPLSDYVGAELRYTPAELKAQLRRITELLRSYENYRVVLTDGIPDGTMLYAKEGAGCIFARLKEPATVFYASEERLSAAFWAYLQQFADMNQSRELVIRHLEDYMEKL